MLRSACSKTRIINLDTPKGSRAVIRRKRTQSLSCPDNTRSWSMYNIARQASRITPVSQYVKHSRICTLTSRRGCYFAQGPWCYYEYYGGKIAPYFPFLGLTKGLHCCRMALLIYQVIGINIRGRWHANGTRIVLRFIGPKLSVKLTKVYLKPVCIVQVSGSYRFSLAEVKTNQPRTACALTHLTRNRLFQLTAKSQSFRRCVHDSLRYGLHSALLFPISCSYSGDGTEQSPKGVP